MSSFEGKKDFTVEVQAAIPESINISKTRGIDEALAYLLPLEKSCRVNNDNKNLREINLHLVRLCRELNDWNKLNAVLTLINRRSSQYKTALSSVVTEVMTYIDHTPSLEIKIELIKSLKEMCDGKIYVEAESAHLHFMLAKIYENQGNIPLACDTVQDVHVETYGSLSKKEKGTYILEQIRLNLLRKDYIRTAIHSRKMNLKTIDEIGFEDIKIHYYQMQIEYYTHEKNTWEISQAYFKIASTKGDAYSEIRLQSIQDCITFLLLSKHETAQQEMLFRVKNLLDNGDWKEIKINPLHKEVLTLFTTNEIINTPFPHQDEFLQQENLRRYDFDGNSTKHFLHLTTVRIIEHNIRIVSKYYQRIRLSRLGQLLSLSQETLEFHLSDLSFSGDIVLKIDRPNGIVSFEKKRSAEEILSQWSNDINSMMSLIETTCHLINRENMVYKM
eukprot:gene1033-1095_t